MHTPPWSHNLFRIISESKDEAHIIQQIQSDKTVLACIYDFIEANNLLILYGAAANLFIEPSPYQINCPILEGVPSNKIQWTEFDKHFPENFFICLFYIFLDDTIDSLYEYKLICEHYGLEYNLKNLRVKCLVDRRTPEHISPSPLSIEVRANIIIQSVLKNK